MSSADVRLAVAKLVSTEVHTETPSSTVTSTTSGRKRSSIVPSMRKRNQSDTGTITRARAPTATARATRARSTSSRNAWLPREPVRQPSTRWRT